MRSISAPCGSAPLKGRSCKDALREVDLLIKDGYRYAADAGLKGYVRRRLRALLRKQEKRPGFGRCLADQMRWTNAFFAEAGLFALHTAWQEARGSR